MQRYSIGYFARSLPVLSPRHFFFAPGMGKVGIVVICRAVAIIDNTLRIIGLSLLANYVDTSSITDGSLHDLGGYLAFVVVDYYAHWSSFIPAWS